MSLLSPCNVPPSYEEQRDINLEIAILMALELYPPAKLLGIHRHFVLYGLMEYMRRNFGRNLSAEEVLQLLGRFYDLEFLEPDDEDMELLNRDQDFCLPPSFFIKEDC